MTTNCVDMKMILNVEQRLPQLLHTTGAAERWLEDQGFPARATEASEEGGANASAEASGLLWVCDGDWDLRSMIPRQCVLSDVPQPAFMLRWADLRYASV